MWRQFEDVCLRMTGGESKARGGHFSVLIGWHWYYISYHYCHLFSYFGFSYFPLVFRASCIWYIYSNHNTSCLGGLYVYTHTIATIMFFYLLLFQIENKLFVFI
eukprot:GHVS01048033.1.p1 GENE.GHVS01048033.1~~GHVS01048033.1.p1  ORF type:complete len:104 (+),score=2.70 GHVS01048033.1:835-1146(+)